jgi:nitrogen regulatory protein PII
MEDGVVENILNYFYGKERKIFVSEVNDATDIKTRRRADSAL